MATFSWLPLELWRASAVSQETKAVITLYENVANGGDGAPLASLRASIEGRMDDLEAFYSRHAHDERAVLFEKQRLKLRKLLAEYDAYTASLTAGSPPATAASPATPVRRSSASVPGPSSSSSSSMTTRVIREDSRLTLPELTAWFTQAGADEMPEVTPAVVASVFATVTRTNPDGKLSIRDLRQWYVTFGRHALAASAAEGGRDPFAALTGAAPSASLSAAAASQRGSSSSAAAAAAPATIVSVPVMRSLNVHLATTATKTLLAGHSGSGSGRRRGSKDRGSRPLYHWEQPSQPPGAGDASGSSGSDSSPTPGGGGGPHGPSPSFSSLPNGLLEFQVRLTPEEHAAVGRVRRALDAEARYKSRMESAHAKAAAKRGAAGVLGGGSGGGSFGFGGPSDGASFAGVEGGGNLSALRLSEPYAEPLSRDAAALLSRSP